MINAELKEVLENILYELGSYDYSYINHGGCCYFAKLIAKELENKGIPFTVCFNDWDSKDLDEYEAQANGALYNYSANHVYININGELFDSEGFHNIEHCDEELMHFEWNARQVRNYYKMGSWNNTFKFEISKPKRKLLKQLIKEGFEQYDTANSA